MEFKYSTIVDPSTYETEGLCDGIDLRKHNHTYFEDQGAIRAHEDWTKHISPVTGYRGTLGPEYSFMTVSVPECIPERLEIIAYANEFAFLHDDVTDNVSHELSEIENDDMMEAFREGARDGDINTNSPETKRVGKKQIQAKMLLKMQAIDRECALVTMKAWAKFVEVGSSRQHDTSFATLNEYLPYRIMDVGEMFWYGVVTFGMGIRIPDEELDICRELMQSAWIAVGLTNDLYSWPKEHEAAIRNGQPHVMNAIWVIMREHGITAEEAQVVCRGLIKQYVAEYVQVVQQNKNNASISIDLRKYIEAMQYSISGNVIWSLRCPRYNPHVSFNDKQLEWMATGVPDQEKLASESEQATSKDNVSSPPVSSRTSSFSGPQNRISYSTSAPTATSSHSTRDEDPMNTYNLVLDQNLPCLGTEVVLGPFDYLCSLPSKGIRTEFIDALNHWLQAPREAVEQIKTIVTLLHNSSLLLDDFQDSSPLRRGKPATHTIYGPAQTINSSSYCIVKALDHVRTLADPACLDVAIGKIMTLFAGQSFDLHWTYNMICPSISEYLGMIDSKTGELFQLVSHLMLAKATTNSDSCLDTFSTLLGRYFQIRDDYQNLVSQDYTNKKGFCEDLDEGKYSLPLLHLLQTEPDNLQICNILSARRVSGKLTYEQKVLILDHLKRTKSLEYTASILKDLHKEIGCEIETLEKTCGTENVQLKLLWEMLRL